MRRGMHQHPFLFATGIENSYPTIAGEGGKNQRVDELEKTHHYKRWREDFALLEDMQIKYLRYGPPLYRVHTGPGQYDWSFVDETFNELQRLGIQPVADLCHFGLPDWLGNFQNAEWPHFFAEFARAFAARYHWVTLYTPVNELGICAKFSALQGMWNERLKDDRAFVTALKHMARATVLAQQSILEVQPNAIFVQSESSEYYHAEEPDALPRAEFYNQRRFVALDLIYGKDVVSEMYNYLTEHGMTREEYQWLMENGSKFRSSCVLGNDYYVSNEHAVPPGDGEVKPSGEIFGYYIITREYADRYLMPIMHTETNHRSSGQDARFWLNKQWSNVMLLKRNGYPIIGFTWYSLIDQVDWDSTLTQDKGHVDPLGLYDLDRHIRPVGGAYRQLIERWRDVLPTEKEALELQAV